MKIISFGSLNIDKIYQVKQFVLPGETIHACDLGQSAGGKGLNQSVAASKAGACVLHAGAVGEDGKILTEILDESGVDSSCVMKLPGQSGHAIIQVDEEGHNCIIVYGGSNQKLTEEYADQILEQKGEKGDIVLLQNETNLISYIMKKAHTMGMKVAFNPSPIPSEIEKLPLNCVDYFFVNEVEGAAIAGVKEESVEFGSILDVLSQKYPAAMIVLTLGSEGALCKAGTELFRQEIYRVKPVDTTAAGDTFCGYFLAGICKGLSVDKCLKIAAAAAAIAVSNPGAAPSIPGKDEVEEFINKYEQDNWKKMK